MASSLKTFALVGLICGYFILICSIYYAIENVTKIVSGDNVGFLGLPVNLAWALMTFAFIVSIKKKNLKLAKLYKTFFVTSFIGTVLLEVILIHVEADNQVQIYETTVNVWTLTLIVIGVALGMNIIQ
ncbi:hypothetical protein pipiens_008052 [Culex pipiens pipiens]|uniref:Uncharacterized protein n=1 Tax=Culex pipiens pipiens TaxID=38569 RepID=A0ABD1DIS5_CULPP